jgi:hypothetical protein
MFFWDALDLFSKTGVDETCDALFPAFPGPIQPIRIDPDFVPVYTSAQIKLFGIPDNWGMTCYRVIELKEDAAPFVTDFKMEQERGRLRPIHRYSRVERFESVLYQLIGCRGKVPKSIVNLVRENNYDKDPKKVWNSIRKILKANHGRVYYNRISSILMCLGYNKKIQFGDSNELVRRIVQDFRILSGRFDTMKKTLKRVYFPSLRFIACKLLELYEVTFEFDIPFVRTPRKLKAMEEIWSLLSTKK